MRPNPGNLLKLSPTSPTVLFTKSVVYSSKFPCYRHPIESGVRDRVKCLTSCPLASLSEFRQPTHTKELVVCVLRFNSKLMNKKESVLCEVLMDFKKIFLLHFLSRLSNVFCKHVMLSFGDHFQV